jgi:Rrf2 family transcriptional regulator, nitric oxide-sensitive transcriptional repressor
MQLTLFSDLSLRVLMYLASRKDPLRATVTVRGVASMFNVSYTHMVKVVHELGRRGFLLTTRGNGGGVRLSRSPEQIRICEALRSTEGDKAVIDCAKPACPLHNRCLLKSALDRAQAAFFDEMDRSTLADVAAAPALQTLVLLSA